MGVERCFWVVLAASLIGGCATTDLRDHRFLIEGIEIANRSSSDIESFLLAVPCDGVVVTANKLSQGSRSLNKVKPFPYRRNAVDLRWFQNGVKHTMEGLHLSEEVGSSEPVTVVVELHDDGRVVAYKR